MQPWYGGILPGTKKDKSANEICDTVITDRPLAVIAFGISHIDNPNHKFRNRPNGRKDYLISYISEGALYETDKKILFEKNSIVLYKPNQPQYRTFFNDTPSITYWIHFSGNNVEEILNKFGIKSGITNFESPFPFFKDIIDRMYIAADSPFWQELCDCLLMELFIHIGAVNKKKVTDSGYRRLIQYMKENCTRDLPIKAYADFIGFSEVYFVRFFKKATGRTPHEHLIRLRLKKACDMLIHTKLPVKEIASEVGYSTARYFSKAFYDRFGMTPTEYRNGNANNSR
jgi:AraC-like DNA-binding protein